MRIFISYTTRDHGGAEWKEALRAELSSRCSHVLVILSAASLGSKEVREEIDLALARFEGDLTIRGQAFVLRSELNY